MKEKKKIKGGKRVGSGRKPSGRQKDAVTLYVDVSLFGGKAGARVKLYELWDGAITDTGKKSFIRLEEKIFPPSDREVKQKAPKEEKRPSVGDLKPQEQPETNFSINTKPKTLDDLRALCPAEITDKIERGNWLGKERQKYGI